MTRRHSRHPLTALGFAGLLLAGLPLAQAQMATPDPPPASAQRPDEPALIPVPPAPKLPIPDLRTPDDKPVHRALQHWGSGMDRAAASMGLPREDGPKAADQDKPASGSQRR
jgi:hypothetical protein